MIYHSDTLPGMEAFGENMRKLRCQCGCGEVFMQPRVGRVRLYLNDAHKRRAARAARIRGWQAQAEEMAGALRMLYEWAEHIRNNPFQDWGAEAFYLEAIKQAGRALENYDARRMAGQDPVGGLEHP